MPATSLSASMKSIISISGEMIVASNIKSPVAPTAFLIRFDEARISPIPSLKYEPRIGTYERMAYLAVLIEMPSIVPAVIP